jgi:hypothetical protein
LNFTTTTALSRCKDKTTVVALFSKRFLKQLSQQFTTVAIIKIQELPDW